MSHGVGMVYIIRLQDTAQSFPNLVSLPLFSPQASVVIFDVGTVVQCDKVSAVRALVLAVCTAVMSSLPLRVWTEYTAYRVCMYKVCRHV